MVHMNISQDIYDFLYVYIITHSQREAYMDLVRNGDSDGERHLSQNLQAI